MGIELASTKAWQLEIIVEKYMYICMMYRSSGSRQLACRKVYLLVLEEALVALSTSFVKIATAVATDETTRTNLSAALAADS